MFMHNFILTVKVRQSLGCQHVNESVYSAPMIFIFRQIRAYCFYHIGTIFNINFVDTFRKKETMFKIKYTRQVIISTKSTTSCRSAIGQWPHHLLVKYIPKHESLFNNVQPFLKVVLLFILYDAHDIVKLDTKFVAIPMVKLFRNFIENGIRWAEYI